MPRETNLLLLKSSPGQFGPTRWFSPTDPALSCSPKEANLRTGGAPELGNRQPFQFGLLGNQSSNPNYWQEVELPGPCLVRANLQGAGPPPNDTNTVFIMQYPGFWYAPGYDQPDSVNVAFHSKGIGTAWCPFGGKWWFRPVRVDTGTPVNLTFFPMLCSEVTPFIEEDSGAANFHSHFGIAFQPMANDGVTPTLPASNSFYTHYAYHIRKNLVIYVPRVAYVNNGGPNWTNASDTRVDQESSSALIGVSEFLLAANFQQFNQWDTPPPTNIGRGLKTLRAGDRYVLSGDFRYPGPLLLFNLSPNVSYVTLEEWT